MKTQISNAFKYLCSSSLVLLAAFICATGCVSWYVHHPDPLAGWHTASENPNQVIVNDYQNYIHTLSTKEQKVAGPILCFEDGTGQYAVAIEVSLNGKEWRHVLVYNKANKRIKVI
jgi:hypothetical protein